MLISDTSLEVLHLVHIKSLQNDIMRPSMLFAFSVFVTASMALGAPSIAHAASAHLLAASSGRR
ncbi:MAG: hypothetical protein K9M08_13350 [Pirellula sp.]|nr:hypothetical protein [Pirellula sp.]